MRLKIAYMRLMLAVLCGLALTLTSFSLVGTARAQEGATQGTAPMQGELRLNCTQMTAKARQYATEHKLCPPKAPGGVQPNNTVYGSCGSSTLFINQGYATGIARTDEAVASTLGGIVYVSFQINWTNWSTASSGSYSDGVGTWGTTWTRSDYFNTGTGYVTASMGGYVVLVWGGTCDIYNPSDGTTIN